MVAIAMATIEICFHTSSTNITIAHAAAASIYTTDAIIGCLTKADNHVMEACEGMSMTLHTQM